MTKDLIVGMSPEATLERLRNANDGFAITVWQDGTWMAWQSLDAKYAEKDPNWLLTITDKQLQEGLLLRKADERKPQ